MTTPNSSGSGRVPSDQTDVQQPSIEKTPEHALASRFPNVKVSDVAPKRNHVTSDLLHAGAALVVGSPSTFMGSPPASKMTPIPPVRHSTGWSTCHRRCYNSSL